ncbi:MAG: prepilin-type N-terminal cleavage/methylation domain-containing protein [Xanthomonadaceae bacterium]|nr:prepilin-type N-terminal cleavage/methylation domain-containing protein [Xanthomonadaceae bacterium]
MQINVLHKQKGVTLVELMVVMALGLILLLSIGLFYTNVKLNLQTVRSQQLLNRKARIVLEMLNRQTQMAGYSGCLGTTKMFYEDGNTYRVPFEKQGYRTPLDFVSIKADGRDRLIIQGLSALSFEPIGVTTKNYPYVLPLYMGINDPIDSYFYTHCLASQDHSDKNNQAKSHPRDILTTYVVEFDYPGENQLGNLYVYNHERGNVFNRNNRELLVTGVDDFVVEFGLAAKAEDDFVTEYMEADKLEKDTTHAANRIRSVKYTLTLVDPDGRLEPVTLSRVVKIENAWWRTDGENK